MPTAEAYAGLTRFSPALGVDRYAAMIDEDLLSNGGELVNDFEESIFGRLPKLAELKSRLIERGAAWAGMSGSGSTIVGAFRSQADRDRAVSRFADVQAVACETV